MSIKAQSKLIERYGNEHHRIGVAKCLGGRWSMEDTTVVEMTVGGKHSNTTLVAVFDGFSGRATANWLKREVPKRLGNLNSFDNVAAIRDVFLGLNAELFVATWKGDFRGTGLN